MEDGIANGGGGAFIANYDLATGTLDKTWNEINTAFTNKQPCYMALVAVGMTAQTMYPFLVCGLDGSTYMAAALGGQDAMIAAMTFTTDDPNGYPKINAHANN